MITDVDDLIVSAFAAQGGADVKVRSLTPLSGGCVNAAWKVTTNDGQFFLKTNAHAPADLFEREFESLEAMSRIGVLRVPQPISFGRPVGELPGFLLTELIEKGPRPWNFFERFGAEFAEYHRKAAGERFGFTHDNYLGSTPQPNAWSTSWIEFFREHRLNHQLAIAEQNGFTGELQRLGHRLSETLDRWIADSDEPPILLHGDLWSGNYLCTDDGDPAVIDPACYYGRREADIAMTKLFGGFGDGFYEAYEEVWPLEEDSRIRLDIYRLYHLLNHLNLFGSTYLGGCLDILRRYA